MKLAARRTVSVIGRTMMFDTNSISISSEYRSQPGAAAMMHVCLR